MPLQIVAELGASHGQDLERAKRLCVSAFKAGADWVKLQTFTPDTISFPGAGVCPSGPWKGCDLYDLYRKAHMPRDMQDKLIAWMEDRGIPWFSTPFSAADVAWLEKRDCPMYKVSSFDAKNPELAKAIRKTGKKIIASDGLGSWAGADVHLRCVSNYPADPLDYALPDMRRITGPWGISDHTHECMLGIVAISMGATMIEKHIKEQGDTTTPDSAFAITPVELAEEIALWRRAHAIATSSKRSVVPLSGIAPREVTIKGKKVWRRCSSAPASGA